MTATSGAGEHRTGPSGGPSALVPGLRWRRVFPGEERQLGVLRRWLESLLPDCAARGDVACVATELGTNAVRHTASGRGGWFAVEITWHQQSVRVAVADGGASGGPRMIDDPAADHGRGLLVVRGLSVRTGLTGDQRGRLVWADVPWGEAGAAESASSQDPYEAATGDGQAGLASRFAGVPAWFGRSTLQWWALAGGRLVTAASARELANLLGRVLDSPPACAPAQGDTACAHARTTRAASRRGLPGPQLPPGRALTARGERDGTGLGGQGGPRAPGRGRRPGTGARQAATVGGPGWPAAAIS